MRVNGTCGPYTSLFTNSQSPTSSVGIMLPDGMRNASTRKARSRRKIASAPAIDLKFSHAALPPEPRARPRPRAAATLFRETLDFAERLEDAGAAMNDQDMGTGVDGERTRRPRGSFAPARGRAKGRGSGTHQPARGGHHPSPAGTLHLLVRAATHDDLPSRHHLNSKSACRSVPSFRRTTSRRQLPAHSFSVFQT